MRTLPDQEPASATVEQTRRIDPVLCSQYEHDYRPNPQNTTYTCVKCGNSFYSTDAGRWFRWKAETRG